MFVHALHVIWLSKTAVAHALIVSPSTSWPGWAKKIVDMEKGWTDQEGDPTIIKRMIWLGGSTFRHWVLWGNEGKVGSPRVARVARRITLLPWTTFLHIKGAFRFPLIFRSEKLYLLQCTYRSSVRYFFTQAATSWSCSEEKRGCKVEMFHSVNLWNLSSLNVVWFSWSVRKHRHFTTPPLKSRRK